MPPRKNNQSQSPANPSGATIKARVIEIKNPAGKLAAFASITFSNNGQDLFVVKDLKIFDGSNGYFLAMPSRKTPEGEYQDIAFPLSKEFREKLFNLVMEAWDKGQDAEMAL